MSFEYENWNKGWYSTASEADQQLMREWCRGILHSQRMNVSFMKADGTERHMHCTLHESLIPQEHKEKEAASPRKRSEEAQIVWDIDKQDWRSFRWDRVTAFSFNLGDLDQ